MNWFILCTHNNIAFRNNISKKYYKKAFAQHLVWTRAQCGLWRDMRVYGTFIASWVDSVAGGEG